MDHPHLARLTAALTLAALVTALFYNGVVVPAYAASIGLLVIGAALAIATASTISLTPLAFALIAFWLWLAATLLWTDVAYIGTIHVWLKGGLVLAFVALASSPDRDRVWRWVATGLLITGLALAGHATVQAVMQEARPAATFINPNSYAGFMNLVLLIAAGYLLIVPDHGRSMRTGALAVAVAVLAHGMFLAGGRGAMGALVMGLVVLGVAAWSRVPGRRIALAGGCVGAGALSANVMLHGFIGERLASMADPVSAAGSRLLIWERAWAMLRDAPWHGTGPGTFWLLYPSYRHPDDQSGGFYAHNDYLQTAIEAGWPGLVLLLGVMAAALWTLARAWRAAGLDAHRRVESAALLGGLLAVAAHAFLTFNLYILPTLIALGVVLARLDGLAHPRPPGHAPARAARWVSPRVWRLSLSLLAVAPLAYLVALGGSDALYRQARAAAADGRFLEAHEDIQGSIDLMPGVDTHLIGAAAIYREALENLPDDADDEAALLYGHATRVLDRAQQANPLRPQTYRIRAALLAANPELAGEDAPTRAEADFRRALALDPRYYRARVDYAQFLAAQGRDADAAEVLADGLVHSYYPEPGLLVYYGAALGHLRAVDREGAATRVRSRLDELAQTLKKRHRREPPPAGRAVEGNATRGDIETGDIGS